MNRSLYGIQFLDDLHNHFPEILYGNSRFHTVQDLLSYIRTQAIFLSPYERGLEEYRNQRNSNIYISPHIPAHVPAHVPAHISTVNSLRLSQTRNSLRRAQQSINQEIPSLVPPSQTSRISSQVASQVPSLVPDYEQVSDLYYDFVVPTLVPPSRSNTLINNRTQLIDNSILRAVIGLMNMNELEPVVVRATQDILDTKTTLSAARPSDESENCSICQEHYTEGQAIRRITVCTHRFHKDCVDRWFETNVHCPICRHDIRQ